MAEYSEYCMLAQGQYLRDMGGGGGWRGHSRETTKERATAETLGCAITEMGGGREGVQDRD
jgi:hypothetical protein